MGSLHDCDTETYDPIITVWDEIDNPLEREFINERKGIKKNTMTQLKIEVIGVTGPSFVKTPRGGYNAIEVAYKGPDGKVAGKKLVDFANKNIFATFKDAVQGERFNVESTKDDNGFWQWNSATQSPEGAEQEVSEVSEGDAGASQGSGDADAGRAAGPSKSTYSRGKVTGSNYETPDERKLRRDFDQLKHKQIGRQGCINSAIAYMNANYKEVTVEDILETAEKFRAWSFQE